MDFERRFWAIKEKFRRAEDMGWFSSEHKSISVPFDESGLPLKGGSGYKKASVLFLIGHKAITNDLHVLITKRSAQVGSYAGG